MNVAEALSNPDVTSPLQHVGIAGLALATLAWRRQYPLVVAALVVGSNVVTDPNGRVHDPALPRPGLLHGRLRDRAAESVVGPGPGLRARSWWSASSTASSRATWPPAWCSSSAPGRSASSCACASRARRRPSPAPSSSSATASSRPPRPPPTSAPGSPASCTTSCPTRSAWSPSRPRPYAAGWVPTMQPRPVTWPPSRRPPARRSRRCAGSSACCAPRGTSRWPCRRSPVSPSSTGWCARSARPRCRWTCGSRATRSRSARASTWRRTASPRKASPTRSVTPRPPRRTCWSATHPPTSTSRWSTTAAACGVRHRPTAATGSSASASGWRCTAGPSTSSPRPQAGSASPSACP